MQAEQVQKMENHDSDCEVVEAAIGSTYFNQPLHLTLPAKMDTYNCELSPDITCIDAKPATNGEHGRVLLQEISDMLHNVLEIRRRNCRDC